MDRRHDCTSDTPSRLHRRQADEQRLQTASEERANALSHGLAFALCVAAGPWLLAAGQVRGGSAGAFAAGVLCGAMALQYLASCLYHALPANRTWGRRKRWARTVDYAAIYLLIAGSATPYLLPTASGAQGLASCALLWAVALTGAGLKLGRRLGSPRMSTGSYVLLGCCAFVAASPALWRADAVALALLVTGGGAYLLGTVFFIYDHALRYGHLAWHLFVMVGSGCHVAAALGPTAL